MFFEKRKIVQISLHLTFKNVVDIHAPIKRRSLRNNNLPWIDLSIQRQIRVRNRLYKLFRRLPANENWIAYKSQRNKVTALKRRAVKDFCIVAASNSSNNSSGLFWKRMRPLLPNTKLTDNSSTIHLIEGGAFVPDPNALFNKYFTTPSIDECLLQLSVDDFMNHASVLTIKNSAQKLDFSFEPVSISRVAESLANLEIRKSAGPDGLSPKLLKLSVPVIAGPLTKLFNRCIISSVWPSQWKLSNVTPVYKKEDETSKSNYRPISVLSTIPKVFEKLKCDQLYRHFSPLFSDNMSGFLCGHSCCTALLKLTEDWRLALDSKKDVGVIAIDLSKAFDSICHNLLLVKLRAYGCQESAISLIQSYFTDRFQRVKCNGSSSDWLPVQCGVSQGSLLGPLFFNIFVNDVNYTVGTSSLRLYADDTTQYAAHMSPVVLESTLNHDVIKLTQWFSVNHLQVNAAKTQAMTLGKSQFTYRFSVEDQIIDIEPTLKLLGVTLDKDLDYKPHVDVMLKKAYAKIAALCKIKRLVP